MYTCAVYLSLALQLWDFPKSKPATGNISFSYKNLQLSLFQFQLQSISTLLQHHRHVSCFESFSSKVLCFGDDNIFVAVVCLLVLGVLAAAGFDLLGIWSLSFVPLVCFSSRSVLCSSDLLAFCTSSSFSLVFSCGWVGNDRIITFVYIH